MYIYKSARKNTILYTLAKEDLYTTQVVVRARAKRQKPNQRVVLKGGLISTKDGRLKISQRVEKEATKASRAAVRKVKKEAKEAAKREREAARA